MFTKSAHQDLDKSVILHWLLMSLAAGSLNAIAFIGLGTFATHVTGFGTLFGVHVAEFDWGNALAALAVPLSFLLGAVLSGLLVEARVRRNKKPHYDYVMYFGALLLLAATALGTYKGYDELQSYLQIQKNFVLLSLVCMASGLLNAALSYSSHSTVRITHLTGVTTDLGRGIAEMISLRTLKHAPSKNDWQLSILRSTTIVAFVLGSVIGAFLFHWYSFFGLLFPAAFFFYAGLLGRRSS